MRIVENDLERMLVVDIHAARHLEKARIEGAQAMPDVFQTDPHVVCQCSSEHRILHVVHCTSFNRCRNQVRPQQRCMVLVVINRNHMPIHTFFEHERLTSRTNMLLHQCMAGIHRYIAQRFGLGVVGHL